VAHDRFSSPLVDSLSPAFTGPSWVPAFALSRLGYVLHKKTLWRVAENAHRRAPDHSQRTAWMSSTTSLNAPPGRRQFEPPGGHLDSHTPEIFGAITLLVDDT